MTVQFRISLKPVRRRAEKLGIKNLYELADRAGISHPTMRRWWKDDPSIRCIDIDTLIKLATVLHCDPVTLIEMELI